MKLYSKPEIRIERFNMDIDVLATIDSNSNLYNELHDLYEIYCLRNKLTASEDGFQDYLANVKHYDNSTSMFCYNTYNILS